jgi:hypothetical protein
MIVKRNISTSVELNLEEYATEQIKYAIDASERIIESQQLDCTFTEKLKIAELWLNERRFLIERYQSISSGEEFNLGN